MPKPSRAGWLQFLEVNNNGNQAGGIIQPFTAAVALNVGDAVWISADMTVNKSVVAADHAKALGVVVGGSRSSPLYQAAGQAVNIDSIEPVYDPIAIAAGFVAAGAGETVLVCMLGLCYVICDAAIVAGLRLSPSLTIAGRVKASTDLTIATGVGGIGKLLEASAGAGNAKRAFISTF